MEKPSIQWECFRTAQAFPCFMKGCQKEAVGLRRFPFGETTIQVCLCSDCSKKSLAAVLQGIKAGDDTVFQQPLPISSLS